MTANTARVPAGRTMAAAADGSVQRQGSGPVSSHRHTDERKWMKEEERKKIRAKTRRLNPAQNSLESGLLCFLLLLVLVLLLPAGMAAWLLLLLAVATLGATAVQPAPFPPHCSLDINLHFESCCLNKSCDSQGEMAS